MTKIEHQISLSDRAYDPKTQDPENDQNHAKMTKKWLPVPTQGAILRSQNDPIFNGPHDIGGGSKNGIPKPKMHRFSDFWDRKNQVKMTKKMRSKIDIFRPP